MDRSRLLYLGILLVAIVIVSLSVIFLFQNSSPKTVFEVMPIAMPQWATDLDKPASYINVSVKNTGSVNQTSVVVKLSGGSANSSNEVPEQLSWIVTRGIDVINPGETASISEIFGFGWFTYYRIEVSSAEGVNEMFNQWVPWRSWDMPPPPS